MTGARMSEPDDDFAELFEASLRTKRFEKGQMIAGPIVAIGPEGALINVGVQGEAMDPIDALKEEDGGKQLVVSRRALVEEQQRARAAEIRRSIVEGAVMTGRVTSVREFGAFVDLGAGVQGLLHVSEMGWSRVADSSQVVTPGEEVTVKVLRVDEDTRKIALGLKQLSADPWSSVDATYQIGQVRSGRVTRVAEFGAFVELEPGVEGLAHASTFAPTGRAGGWTGEVPPGTNGSFEILSIDIDKKRIGVALLPEGSAPARGAASS